jgi:hypothetical protein
MSNPELISRINKLLEIYRSDKELKKEYKKMISKISEPYEKIVNEEESLKLLEQDNNEVIEQYEYYKERKNEIEKKSPDNELELNYINQILQQIKILLDRYQIDIDISNTKISSLNNNFDEIIEFYKNQIKIIPNGIITKVKELKYKMDDALKIFEDANKNVNSKTSKKLLKEYGKAKEDYKKAQKNFKDYCEKNLLDPEDIIVSFSDEKIDSLFASIILKEDTITSASAVNNTSKNAKTDFSASAINDYYDYNSIASISSEDVNTNKRKSDDNPDASSYDTIDENADASFNAVKNNTDAITSADYISGSIDDVKAAYMGDSISPNLESIINTLSEINNTDPKKKKRKSDFNDALKAITKDDVWTIVQICFDEILNKNVYAFEFDKYIIWDLANIFPISSDINERDNYQNEQIMKILRRNKTEKFHIFIKNTRQIDSGNIDNLCILESNGENYFVINTIAKIELDDTFALYFYLIFKYSHNKKVYIISYDDFSKLDNHFKTYQEKIFKLFPSRNYNYIRRKYTEDRREYKEKLHKISDIYATSNTEFLHKYLKYKQKYLKLKNSLP